MRKLVIVGDDITGGNACGVKFLNKGISILSLSFSTIQSKDWTLADVLVLNTESRESKPEDAYQQVYEAFVQSCLQGFDLYYKQNDSAMRGHIGLELLAALNATKEKSIVFVPACPDNGRITKDGIHYVNGVSAERSTVSQLATYPPKDGSIIKCLEPYLPVKHIGLSTVEGSIEEFTKLLFHYHQQGGAIVIDATSNKHLEIIASVVKKLNIFLLSGANAFASYIAQEYSFRRENAKFSRTVQNEYIFQNKQPVLLVIGSLSERTQEQIKFAVQTEQFKQVTTKINLGGEMPDLKRLMQEIVDYYHLGKHIILSPEQPKVFAGEAIASSGKQISEQLGKIACKLIKKSEQGWGGMVLSGGETARYVMKELGSRGMVIEREIFPTSPYGSIYGGPFEGTPMILKAGDWGDNDALLVAAQSFFH